MLRVAAGPDIDAIARIWREGWADAHLGHVPRELVEARTAESFASRAARVLARTAVATCTGRVVGFAMIDRDQVDQLYVDRQTRGAAVGALLLQEAERLVLASGYPRAWLAVATGNAAARRFYERQGWIDDGPIVHDAPVAEGAVPVDCHRFRSPTRERVEASARSVR